MSDLQPSYEFDIPSTHDWTSLECRIYHPVEKDSSTIQIPSGAVVAHPYAPLGGSYDDPVVMMAVEQLLECGMVVGTFNFRGAGRSTARTSWTSKPEAEDYNSFLAFFCHYMQTLLSTEKQDPAGTPDASVKIIIGGYSYGAIVASRILSESVAANGNPKPGTAMQQIIRCAQTLAERHIKKDGQVNDASTLPATQGPVARLIRPYYLLISPPLPPISSMLTFGLEQGFWTPSKSHYLALTKTPSLTIFGNRDNFTSAKRFRRWAEELKAEPGSTFNFVEVQGASHFYRERGAGAKLQTAIKDWIEQTVLG